MDGFIEHEILYCFCRIDISILVCFVLFIQIWLNLKNDFTKKQINLLHSFYAQCTAHTHNIYSNLYQIYIELFLFFVVIIQWLFALRDFDRFCEKWNVRHDQFYAYSHKNSSLMFQIEVAKNGFTFDRHFHWSHFYLLDSGVEMQKYYQKLAFHAHWVILLSSPRTALNRLESNLDNFILLVSILWLELDYFIWKWS